MKKNFTTNLITLSCLFALFVSCASTKQTPSVQSDSYDNEDTPVQINNSNDENNSDQNNGSKKITKKKFSEKKSYEKNELEKFFTFGNKDDYIAIDQTSIFSLNLVGGIKQQVCDTYISTKNENEAGFGATIMSNYYIFMMDKENRNKLRIAYENYLHDFENKKLNRKDRKTFKKYGNINVNAHWGALKTTTPSFGNGTVNLGYEFEKNSPYFCMTMYSIYNDYYDIVGDATTRESMTVKYYFTKAQMKDLLNALNEENITNMYNEYYNINILAPAEFDEYSEE